MNIVKEIAKIVRQRGVTRTVTVFPKGTIVKYNGIPCELLEDCMYYSATYQPRPK